ncbi:MAG: hypothetical protein LAP85_15395 [Acidobacteriia bacterium]|nr:hypothetical protein [Terriglobia bacterium]
MSQDIFNTESDEARMVAQELRELKEVLQDVSRKLARIEARAKRAFPGVFSKSPPRSSGTSSGNAMTAPTMTVEQVMSIYDEVVGLAKAGDRHAARRRLDELAVPDLNLLRTELGASLGKRKPSKPALLDAVISRVNESVMLTKHTSRKELIDRVGTDKESDPSQD